MTTDPAFSFCSSTCTLSAVVPPRLRCLQRHDPSGKEHDGALYHRTRPPPARRRCTAASSDQLIHPPRPVLRTPVLAHQLLWAILVCLLFACPAAVAGKVYGASEIFATELLFDRREPPIPNYPRMPFERRQEGLPSTTIRPDATATTAGGNLQIATSTLPATLPKPFDSNLGNNFTSSACPNFFNSFLNDDAFQRCLPFSLLLQTSSSFFTVSRSSLRLSQTLDMSCSANLDQCSDMMASLAREIRQDSTCGADLQMQNPIVTQAYNGLIAYRSLFQAGCLRDADGNYCYTDAITNASASSSSYVYYLPLGVPLPGGSRPTCNQCLQETMKVFAGSATNATQPLSSTYLGAAQQIQMNCGPTFVQTVVPSSAGRAAAAALSTVGLVSLALVTVLLSAAL